LPSVAGAALAGSQILAENECKVEKGLVLGNEPFHCCIWDRIQLRQYLRDNQPDLRKHGSMQEQKCHRLSWKISKDIVEFDQFLDLV